MRTLKPRRRTSMFCMSTCSISLLTCLPRSLSLRSRTWHIHMCNCVTRNHVWNVSGIPQTITDGRCKGNRKKDTQLNTIDEKLLVELGRLAALFVQVVAVPDGRDLLLVQSKHSAQRLHNACALERRHCPCLFASRLGRRRPRRR